jgi:Asp/Glu/hydantoin racemase
MRLLLINSNTSESITDLVVASARAVAAPSTEITGVTARFGMRYIGTRAAFAIAGHAALDAYAAYGADVDAVVLACFGDPGLAALREIATIPVVGMAEAACREAAERGRFAIVTGGARWVPMLTEYMAMLGLAERFAGVHAVAPTGAEIAADPGGSVALLAEACETAAQKFGADVIVLGGAGLAPIAPRVAATVSVPVIDGLVAAVVAAERVAAYTTDRVAPLADTPPSVGLSAELAALFQNMK